MASFSSASDLNNDKNGHAAQLKKNSFSEEQNEQKLDDFDFDRLERGDSKDLLADQCLLPTPVGRRIATGSYTSQHKPAHSNASAFSSTGETNTEWHRCFIERSAKNKFRMYDEHSGNMLLSATKTKEGDFLISQYAAFPDEHESAATKSITRTAASAMASAFRMGASASFSSSSSSPNAATQHDHNNDQHLADGKGKYGYVCTLRLNSSRTGYKLYRKGCELCDNVLQKYSCSDCLNDTNSVVPQRRKSIDEKEKTSTPRANQAVSFSAHGDDANRTTNNINEDRQLLAVIGQSMQEIEHTGVMARYTTMEIPAFLNPNAHDLAAAEHQGNASNLTQQRIVWCPRTLTAQIPGKGPAHVQATLLGRGELSENVVHASSRSRGRRTSSLYADAAVPEKERFRYSCRLPNWSDDVGSLVLTFFGGRVLQPSAKNFMMEDKSAIDSARQSGRNGAGAKDATNVMFQFGKVNKAKFNLDFKHPMSPLQSFALALSSFEFTSKE